MFQSYDPNKVHRITRGELEHVLKCLRHIDQARDALAAKGPGNESIVDELQKCAGGIYQVMKDLPEADSN